MTVELRNESGYEVDEAQLRDVASFAITAMDVHPGAELDMILVDLDTMEDLHVKWLDLPGPTDVMSFPMDELTPGGRPDVSVPGPALLGDLVLCPQFAVDQARDAGHSLNHELNILTAHGVLHLLGYDHVEDDERREMFALQERIVADFYAYRHTAEYQRRMAARDDRVLKNVGLEPADDTGKE